MKTDSLFSLKDRVAIVTGGAGHLGFAISEALAEYGSVVFIASRKVSGRSTSILKLRKRFENRIQAITMDISSSKSIQEAYNYVLDEHKRIDILVNNAHFGAGGDLESMPEKAWNKGFDGTINSVFRCTKEVIPIMKRTGRGSIINMASMYGMVSPNPEIYGNSGFNNPPNYGSGKAAIIQFTRYAACHLAPHGIRVNAVSPGPFPNKDVQKNEIFVSNLKTKVPRRRIGHPHELKGVIVLLASDASSYITGVNIPVDGGWTAW
jgi:gluconate 5-dehydrogenase